MKKKLCFFACLVLTIAIATPGSATQVVRFNGDAINAFFSDIDPSGCVQTSVAVGASNGWLQVPPGGPPQPNPGVYLAISKFNLCTGTQLMSIEANPSIPASDLQIDGLTFASATLKTAFNVCDSVSRACFDVTLNLAWIATGPAAAIHEPLHSEEPGLKVNFHWNGRHRPADATGTVSDGTTNFAPGASLNGDIGRFRQGWVYIETKK